jgi:putative ABC transport system ATP-binding protein
MIETKNLLKKFGAGELELIALKNLNVEIVDGEFVSIVGPSGAGKSTLLYQLSLLDQPSGGEVLFDQKPTARLSQAEKTWIRLHKMGFVFQDYALLPELTAVENVALPMIMQGMSKKMALDKAKIALERIGMSDKTQNLPSQLSGGQQQRVSIARAIAHHPKVLFADEPTANLDSENSHTVIQAFLDLHAEGQTIVMVTHEIEYARKAKRTISMRDGAIISDAKNQQKK